jgi:ribosomal protein S18 acetylase RimI-like enzyme
MQTGRAVTIGKIGVGDLHRVRALARRIWPECFAGVLPADIISPMVEAIYDLDVLRADVEVHRHVYWIAQIDGEDAGYASAYREADCLWIKKLYLLDSSRGLGLGKRLIATAQQELSGATSLALYVNEGNASAIAFYRSQGFTIDSLVPVSMGGFEMKDYVMTRPVISPATGV